MAVLPSNLRIARLAFTSSAIANGAAGGILLAALGPGLRYRIWGWYIAPGETSQAAANWRSQLGNQAGTAGYGQMQGSNYAASPAPWLPGGLAIPTGEAVRWWIQSTAAALAFEAFVYYTIEATG